MNINESKTRRQKECLNKWLANSCQGTIIAATGFGKTFLSIMGIRGLRNKGLVETVIVTVPTRNLKEQWEEELSKHKQSDNVTVLVNNTAAKNAKDLSADLVIHDETHTVPAEYMSKCLEIQRKYTLCLTATIERKDGNEELILDKYPIVDEVKLEECLDNGWISPYTVYNIAVPLSTEDYESYKKADNTFKHFAAVMGFGNTMATAKMWLAGSDPDKKGKAMAYYRSIRNRKEICVNNVNKFQVIKELMDFFPDRYSLIFGESTEFADDVTEMLGDTCMTFHSKMGKKAKADAMKRYKDKRTKIRTISSVKALDAGFDFPEVSLGIIAAGNSSLIKSRQRLGRIVRAVEGKEAVIINLYSPHTQETKWLTNRLEGIDCIWVSSIAEFKEIYDGR